MTSLQGFLFRTGFLMVSLLHLRSKNENRKPSILTAVREAEAKNPGQVRLARRTQGLRTKKDAT
jgi:hypothetical protein